MLVLVVAVPAAYALARRVSSRWATTSAVLLGFFLVLQMVPQPMAVIPLYGILADWRLVGSLTGLVLADVALLVPFGLLLLRPFVLAIPRRGLRGGPDRRRLGRCAPSPASWCR